MQLKRVSTFLVLWHSGFFSRSHGRLPRGTKCHTLFSFVLMRLSSFPMRVFLRFTSKIFDREGFVFDLP